MKKNVASQTIGTQMVTAADGSAFTGAVTVYYTLDGGAQTIGSVGSGVCTHEGNGLHTYTPTAGETNGVHISWTFIGTGAYPKTEQLYTVDEIADVVWDRELKGNTHNIPTSAGRRLRQLAGIIFDDGIAQAGGVNSITLAAAASSTDGIFWQTYIFIVAGTGAGQGHHIVDYDGATRVATIDDDWIIQPDNTSEYTLFGSGSHEAMEEGTPTAVTDNTITLNTFSPAVDDQLKHLHISIISGTGNRQTRRIIAYNGTTKVATIDENWAVNPDTSSGYWIQYGSLTVDDVWDEVLESGTHNVNKSAGKRLRELLEVAGYEGGFIYYDDVNGAAGNEKFINGTLENPVNNEADLVILKSALGIDAVKIAPEATLTLTVAHEGQEYIGEAWTLNLGGQSISASFFHGSTSVNGIATGAIPPKLEDCVLNDVTMPPSRYYLCGFAGIFTIGSIGDYFFLGDSHSAIAGVGAPSFDYGAAIGVTNLNFRGYHGGQNVKNMKTGDNLSFDGDGQIVIDTTSGPGTMRISGHQKLTGDAAFRSKGGIISDEARFAVDQIPHILVSTTIATLASQTSFTLSAGSSDDNAYNNSLAIITDATTGAQKAVGLVFDYVGATKTITLASDPAIFTMAADDKVALVGNTSAAVLSNTIISEKVETLLDINKPLNLTVDTTTRLEYQWLDTDGDPVDISAMTMKFKAVKNAGESSPAIPEVTGTISDGANGRWYFDILPLTVFKGRYEIWADSSGTITPLTMAGGVRIETHPRL